MSTSSEFISGKNQATAPCRQSETICKETEKPTNDLMIADKVRVYKVPFILSPR